MLNFSFAFAAQLNFFTNENDWLQATTGFSIRESIEMNAANVALADGVTGPVQVDDNLGNPLNFQKANTGLSWNFEITSLQAGSELIFEERFPNSIAVGDSSTGFNDDEFTVDFSGNNLLAFGISIVNNDASSASQPDFFQIFDENGTLLGEISGTQIPISPGNVAIFLGVVSDTSIGSIAFLENALENVDIRKLQFSGEVGTVPEPGTFWLLGMVVAFGCFWKRP